MGPLVVLMFWAVFGSVAAAVGGAVLAGLTALAARGPKRRRAIALAAIFPFLCLVWAGAVMGTLAMVNVFFLDRDMGFGDGWYTPLPNGYTLLMIDVTDHAALCPTLAQEPCSDLDGVTVDGVTRLQLFGSAMIGVNDEGYFLLDKGQRRTFATEGELAKAAGVTIHLAPVERVYRTYRYTWADALGLVLLVLPPGFLAVAAAIRIWRSRGLR